MVGEFLTNIHNFFFFFFSNGSITKRGKKNSQSNILLISYNKVRQTCLNRKNGALKSMVNLQVLHVVHTMLCIQKGLNCSPAHNVTYTTSRPVANIKCKKYLPSEIIRSSPNLFYRLCIGSAYSFKFPKLDNEK